MKVFSVDDEMRSVGFLKAEIIPVAGPIHPSRVPVFWIRKTDDPDEIGSIVLQPTETPSDELAFAVFLDGVT